MEFHEFTLNDLEPCYKIFNENQFECCDYTLYILYAWAKYYDVELSYVDDGVIIKSSLDNETVYSLPVNLKDIDKYMTFKNYFLCQDELDMIKDKYKLEITPLRDSFDYVYGIEQLAYLKGKSNNKLRNHVNRFNTDYENRFKVSEITQEDGPTIVNFLEEYRDKENKQSSYNYDIEKVKEFFLNYDLFKKYFYSYKLEIDGKICGIVSGEIIKDTLFIHILKCFKEYSGIFHFLNKDFCLRMYEAHKELKYVNREDDTGDEGLRKSKLQYHPIRFIEKYSVKML